MNTAARLSAYGAVLALIAGGAWAAGSAVGPLSVQVASSGHGGTSGAEGAGHGDGHSGTVAEAAQNDLPSGLASSRGGELFDGMCNNLPLRHDSCIEVRCENQARSNLHSTTGTDRAEANVSPAHERTHNTGELRREQREGTGGRPAESLAGGQIASRRLHSRVEPTFGSDAGVGGTKRHVLANGGYTLTPPIDTTLTVGANTFSFRIAGPDGAAVTAFDVEHDKQMHLIVIRRDTAGFQHLHPELAADGTWTAPLTVAEAGSYRVFAAFKPTGGAATTLGTDVNVAGSAAQPATAPTEVQPTEVQPAERQPTERRPAHPTEEGHGHGG